MFDLKSFGLLLDKAEALAVEAENVIKKKPESITNLVLALNNYRLAQEQTLQDVDNMLINMERLENEANRLNKQKSIDNAINNDTINKSTKKVH